MSQVTTTNQNQPAAPVKHTIKTFFERPDVKSKFSELMGNRSTQFITSLMSIVNNSNHLKEAEPQSVYMAAMMAAALDLPINPNLGFAYIIPYKENYKDEQNNWKSRQVAQFQLGYKGLIQLAQRSGAFKTISATPIFEGQIVSENPLTGFVFDFTKPSTGKIVGYAAYFALLNGFEKTYYMTKAQVEEHAKRFSKTYGKKGSVWETDYGFDAMSLKTVLKHLLGKYAPLSVEMQKAIVSDQAVINDIGDGNTVEDIKVSYVDRGESEPEIPQEVRDTVLSFTKKQELIEFALTQIDLEKSKEFQSLVEERLKELKD